jgi:hypothetical protein
MRKLILSLVFVLATGGTLMNANSITEVKNSNQLETVKMDCVGMAFEANKKASLSYEQFKAVVESCEAAQE